MTPDLGIVPAIQPIATIERGLRPVDPLPIEYLPDRVLRYVKESSAAIGVPDGMVAAMVLVTAGGILGRSVAIEEKPGTIHYPSLWISNIADPGVGKTQAMGAAAKPVRELQSEAKLRYLAEREAFDADQASRSAKKDDQQGRPTQPRMETLWISDFTIESLAPLTEREPGIVALIDEKSGMFGRMNQYRSGGKGGDRQAFLSLWSSEQIKVDRKSSDPILVECPVVAIGGSFQPATIRTLFDGSADGFSDRELIHWPDAEPSEYSRAVVTTEVMDGYRSIIRDLYAIRREHSCQAIVIPIADDAFEVFVAWFNRNQQAIRLAPPVIKGHYAKLPAQALRIALVLHMLTHPRNPSGRISKRTIEGAIAFAEAFSTGTRRALDYVGAQTPERRVSDSDRIMRFLSRHGDWASLTDLHNATNRNWSGDRIHAAIDELVGLQVIETRKHVAENRTIDQWRTVAHG
jgi:hypothetical protein